MEGKKEQSENYYNQVKNHLKLDKLDEIENDILRIKEAIEISVRMKTFTQTLEKSESEYFNKNIILKINPTYETPDDKENVIKQVKQYAYYRLYYYLKNSEEKDGIKQYVLLIFLKGLIKMSENDLFIPLMLHTSRGLIDSNEVVDSATQCIKKSFNIKLFDVVETNKKKFKLDETKMKIIYSNETNNKIIETNQQQIDEETKKLTMSSFYVKGVELYKNTLTSDAGKLAIENFLKNFQDDNIINLDVAIREFLYNTKFLLIENVSFIAMTGFNNTVYFNLAHLNSQDEKFSISRTISNCYHEAAHVLIRYYLNYDFGIVTPRQKDENELEAGFLMERILFGTSSYQYWANTKIIDENEWNRGDLPLYKEEEYRKCNMRAINCFRSGLEYENELYQFE